MKFRPRSSPCWRSALPCLRWRGTPVAGGRSATLVPLDIFTVPEGLEVTVWAQSPMLKNPTNMDIDAAGRIWVTEGVNYRRHKERDAKGDRVVVLEDTDGDGRADKSTVFVQEPTLVAPLGIAVLDNKVIVSNAPDLIVYTDVNRDRDIRSGRRQARSAAHGLRRAQSRPRAALGDLRARWPLVLQPGQRRRALHRSRRQDLPRRQHLQPGARWRRAAGVRLRAAQLRGREERRRPRVRRRFLRAHAARWHGRGDPRLQLPQQLRADGHELRRHLPQRQRRSAGLPHHLPDGVRQPRLLLARRQTLLAGRSPARAVHSRPPSGARKIRA